MKRTNHGGRPARRRPRKRDQIHVRLLPDTADALRVMGREHGITIAQLVQAACDRFIAAQVGGEAGIAERSPLKILSDASLERERRRVAMGARA